LTLTTLVAIALTAVLPIYPGPVPTACSIDSATRERPDASPTDAAPASTSPKIGPAVVNAAAPPLDLAGLEKRLRDTSAIGVFTKLALKNQVDDLLEQFKAFHEGRGPATLDDLREHYDLLLLKVLSLLQSRDPRLAQDLSASRDAIWAVLSDPVRFSTATAGG
jgi:hypothetical protein